MKSGQVSVELGKALNRAEELRLIADYKGDSLEIKDAEWVVDQGEKFVQEMKGLIFA